MKELGINEKQDKRAIVNVAYQLLTDRWDRDSSKFKTAMSKWKKARNRARAEIGRYLPLLAEHIN
jgi:hypothetical protein